MRSLFLRESASLRVLSAVCATILSLCLGATTAHAQSNAGITGTVLDTTGAVIPNASVTILNEQTGSSQVTTSSSAGTFSVTGLTPDKYRISVGAQGFSTQVQKDVTIDVSVIASLTFTLTAGSSAETVQVSADTISLNTTDPQIGSTLEPEVIEALPTAVSGRGRQIDSLQFTAPGTTGSTFSHRISGGVDFQQEILYNGVPVVQPETEGYTTNFNPPFEMVQEFRVEQSTFSSQFGLGQGALTYQMATGTNTYHGDIFEINRNSFFDSVGFFQGPNFTPTNTRDIPPTDHENNYGFTIGGPLSIPHLYNAKDKTFFHYSQEWYKQVQENINPGTVPTAQELTGDFSDFVDSNGNLIPIYVPPGFNCDGLTPGTQFPGNVIPTACISPTSAALVQYIPAPNLPGHVSNRSYTPYPNNEIQHVWGFTIDHKLTSSQSIHYSEWRNTYNNIGFDVAPIVAPPNPLNSLKTFPNIGTGFVVTYNYSLTPHLVMTAGADWIGEVNNQFNATKGYSSPVIQNGNIPPEITFDGTYAPTQWGTSGSWGGSVNRKLGLSAANNWLWTKGRHTFNIGGEARRAYQDDNEEQTSGGNFTFSHRETSSDPSSPTFGSYGSAFASFLLGLPDEANRSNSQELQLRNFDLSPYIEDDIKLTPKLTVNLGLRWDIMVPFTENNNKVVFFDPKAANVAADNLLGAATQLGSTAGYSRADIDWRHFGPRFGLSYQLNSKTVVQGGYSLAYLNGGAYEYGTHKVAVSYGNLLTGSYSRNSTGSNNSSYGSWDNNPMPNPAPTPFSSTLGVGTQIFDFSRSDGYAPYTQQWNINVQHQLPWNTFLTVAWVGNRSVHLDAQLNPVSQLPAQYLALGNSLSDVFQPGQTVLDGVQVPYANFVSDFGGSATVRQALQPYPQYGNVYNLFDHGGTTYYESLQVSAQKRLSNGLSFLAGYTLSRLMDNTSSGFSTFTATAINKFNQKPEYTVSGSDEPNTLKVSGTYELPIGPGKQYFNNKGVTGQVLGGWQVSWVTDYEAGTAFGAVENSYLALGNSLEGGNNRPNFVGGHSFNLGYGSTKNFFTGKIASQPTTFNTAAFSDSGAYAIGNAVRNYTGLRNPAFFNENANVRKHFFIGERVQAILQFDYFNLFNRTQFQNPDNNFNDSTFGQITNFSSQTNATSNGNRQGQIQARIEF